MIETTTTIYEVIAKTAAVDYGSRSTTISMGLYFNKKSAELKVNSIKSKPHWYMDYETVDIIDREVIN